jgi:DNA repair exonuclease SbcCD ATPase subunit
MTTQTLKSKLERLRGQRDHIKQQYQETRNQYIAAYRELSATEEARALIQRAAQMTQDQIRYHITDLGTTALQAVFEDTIQLDLQFLEQKDKTVANLRFLRFLRGQDLVGVDPVDADSGGACDIAAEALRDSLWYLKRPRTMPTMVRDEPFKNINDPSREMQRRAAEMIRQISDRLKIQFLIVTMLPELEEVADKVFEVK